MTVEVLTQPLAIPAVAARAMAGEHDSRYESRPSGKAAWTKRIRGVMDESSGDWLRDLEPAIAASSEAQRRLARSASGKGVVVTTGQQPGLFGGPVYNISKALSALALANALEKLTGVPVAPVFWAATDDSDFREASKTVIAVPGGARELAIDAVGAIGTPMSSMPLGDTSALLTELAAACGSGVDPHPLDLVKRCYSSGQTIGGAYVQLLREILAPLGVSVLDASHPAAKLAAAPALQLALERGDDIARGVAANNAEIEKSGFPLQVQVVAGLSLVFENTPDGRKRIPRKKAGRAHSPDSDLGPNVLLRPIVERNILPTVAYIGGPAEIAYFAQLGPIAAAIGLPRPLIVPRWSCTIVEPHVRKIVQRLGVEIGDLRDPHAVETRIAKEKLPGGILAEVSALRAAMEERSDALASALKNTESLVGSSVAEGLRRNLLHRVDRLERRLVAASKRRHADLMHDAATARGSLFPFGRPQERALSFIPLLARYGGNLCKDMLRGAAKHTESLL